MKAYQAMFIFKTTLSEETVAKTMERIIGEISKLKGEVSASRNMGRRMFSRPMKKTDAGQYVEIDFAMDPGSINALQARLKLIEDIFRVQVMAKENVIETPPRAPGSEGGRE